MSRSSGRRLRRLADLLRAEISTVLLQKVKDPRLGFVTVTGVEVSPDAQHATVYYSVLGDEEEHKATREALQSATGFIKAELGKVLDLRYIPSLKFRFDSSLEEAAHLEKILKETPDD